MMLAPAQRGIGGGREYLDIGFQGLQGEFARQNQDRVGLVG